jgi:hypothetical protein
MNGGNGGLAEAYKYRIRELITSLDEWLAQISRHSKQKIASKI